MQPRFRVINRSDYYNGLLQKSNFFSSTFLHQAIGNPTKSPFALFNQEHCSASSVSSSATQPSSSPESTAESRSCNGSAREGDEEERWKNWNIDVPTVLEMYANEDCGRQSGCGDDNGMAKEAEAEEPVPQPLSGYSEEVEAERRVSSSGGGGDSKEDGLEIRHEVLCAEVHSALGPLCETALNKAKEEEKEESAQHAPDAIDMDIADAGASFIHQESGRLIPRGQATAHCITTSPPTTTEVEQSGSRRGDMYVKIKVTVPRVLSHQQAQLLATLQYQYQCHSTADA